MRIALLSVLLVTAFACEESDGDTSADPLVVDTNEDTGASDCSAESVDDPLNPGGGAHAAQTINGAVCTNVRDEFSINVSTGCTLQAKLTFDEQRDDAGALEVDGDLELQWYGAGTAIGTTSRDEDGTTVTLTNNPEGDSFGAVRVVVEVTTGERLDYALTLGTSCPS